MADDLPKKALKKELTTLGSFNCIITYEIFALQKVHNQTVFPINSLTKLSKDIASTRSEIHRRRLPSVLFVPAQRGGRGINRKEIIIPVQRTYRL